MDSRNVGKNYHISQKKRRDVGMFRKLKTNGVSGKQNFLVFLFWSWVPSSAKRVFSVNCHFRDCNFGLVSFVKIFSFLKQFTFRILPLTPANFCGNKLPTLVLVMTSTTKQTLTRRNNRSIINPLVE